MSNFGQSSLDSTKAAARSEHEDSDRGKCSTPGLIRKTAGLNTHSLRRQKKQAEKAEEDVERREWGEKDDKRVQVLILKCTTALTSPCQCLLM